MFVTNWISTTKIQKISEITNFFRHYFLSRTEVYKSLQEECFDVLGLNEEQIKVREQMSRYILDAEEVYIGARIGNEYRIGYDVDNDESLETLRNLEE